MSTRGTYITTLAVFVTAAFFIGLVTGVNWTRGEKQVTPACTLDTNTGPADQNAGKGPNNNAEQPVPKEAPDFSLVDPETGETVELKDFAGSDILLFVSTVT
jgi:hypothetical protein